MTTRTVWARSHDEAHLISGDPNPQLVATPAHGPWLLWKVTDPDTATVDLYDITLDDDTVHYFGRVGDAAVTLTLLALIGLLGYAIGAAL